MKTQIIVFAACGGCAALACAQNSDGPATFAADHAAQRPAPPAVAATSIPGIAHYSSWARDVNALGRQYSLQYMALADLGDPLEGGGSGHAANLIGGAGRRAEQGIRFYRAPVRGVSAGASYADTGRVDSSIAGRAWGMSIGVSLGAVTLRAAHQNRHVARVRMYDLVGINMDAKNSLIAANVRMGWGTAYAGYSANRGWGNSPLFNPDNPYGASLASTPSLDSRDVLLGVAVPLSHATTFLASYIRRNDRDDANRDANQLAIGASYAMSRRTDFYAAFSHIRYTGGPGMVVSPTATPGGSTSAVSIGMRHAF